MKREQRRAELERISRGKNGMLRLHHMRQLALGTHGSPPVIRPNDSLEHMIQEILDAEFKAEEIEEHSSQSNS
jgi:hypothetical protein